MIRLFIDLLDRVLHRPVRCPGCEGRPFFQPCRRGGYFYCDCMTPPWRGSYAEDRQLARIAWDAKFGVFQ